MEEKEGALAEQIGGVHYKGMKIEPVELWAALDLNAFQGSIVKYVMRYKDKNGKQDLLKAKHYIDYIKQFTPKTFTPDTKEAADYLDRFIKENELSEKVKDIIVDVVYEDYDDALLKIDEIIDDYTSFKLATEAFNELGDRNNMVIKEDDINDITLIKPLVLPKGATVDQFKEVVETINSEADTHYYRIPNIEEFKIGYKYEQYDPMNEIWRPMEVTKEAMIQLVPSNHTRSAHSFMADIEMYINIGRIRVHI